MKGIIVVDVERCLGCKSCELACAVAHSESKELTKAIVEEPRPEPRVSVESGDQCSIPMQCRHCEDAPCVAICPAEALVKLDVGKPVLLRKERCIGCSMCILACPFGVLKMSRDGRVITKCDLCVERLGQGQEPACAEACPTGALRYMTVDEASKEKRTAAVERFLVELRKGNDVGRV
ncbi:MAG: 4Fe-4S dicluster domain-containing protein [Candidatus Hydrogenedentes bacterium]|nr:4Fe-4S dicluster domain-containing protein [Candidatus Hydrogenedentota bacterium]